MFTNKLVVDRPSLVFPTDHTPEAETAVPPDVPMQLAAVALIAKGYPGRHLKNLYKPFARSALLFMLIAAAGCASGRNTVAQRIDAVKEEGKVIAVVRNDVNPESYRGIPAKPSKKYHISVASIDRGEQPRPIESVSLEDPTNKKGWQYLALSPGTYFFDMEEHDGKRHLAYWFDLAKEAPATYIGSISHDCGDARDLDCLQIIDEHDLLQAEIADTGLGGALTHLMKPYPASDHCLSPQDSVGLAVGPAPLLRPPGWRLRAIRGAVGLGLIKENNEAPVLTALTTDVDLLLGGGNLYVVFLSAPIGALHLVYLPIGYGIGNAMGSSAEKKWRPCMEAIAERAQRMNAAEVSVGAAKPWAEKHAGPQIMPLNTDVKNPPALVLSFDSLRVTLHECGRGGYCVELAGLVRLSENGDATHFGSYVYSCHGREPSTKYEIVVEKKSDCRDLEASCQNAEGIDTLIDDVRRGIQAITEAALQDVLCVPGPVLEEKPAPTAQ